jgi:superfamily II DNA or RNA helicase
MINGEVPLIKSINELSSVAKEKFFRCKTSVKNDPNDNNYPTFTKHLVFFPIENLQDYQEQTPDFLIGFRRYAPQLKIRWIINKIREILRDQIIPSNHKKIVVYSEFIENLNLLATELTTSQIPYKKIVGDISSKNREKYVKQYNEEGEDPVNVLLISKAGEEGLDLKRTNSVILMEPSWTNASHDQIIGRGVRFMSHKDLSPEYRHVNIYFLLNILPSDSEAELLGIDVDNLNTGNGVEKPENFLDDYVSFDIYKDSKKKKTKFTAYLTAYLSTQYKKKRNDETINYITNQSIESIGNLCIPDYKTTIPKWEDDKENKQPIPPHNRRKSDGLIQMKNYAYPPRASQGSATDLDDEKQHYEHHYNTRLQEKMLNRFGGPIKKTKSPKKLRKSPKKSTKSPKTPRKSLKKSRKSPKKLRKSLKKSPKKRR